MMLFLFQLYLKNCHNPENDKCSLTKLLLISALELIYIYVTAVYRVNADSTNLHHLFLTFLSTVGYTVLQVHLVAEGEWEE